MSVSINANNLITSAEDGITSWESIARAAIGYMSDYDLGDMIESDELVVLPLPEVYDYQVRKEMDGTVLHVTDDEDMAERIAQQFATDIGTDTVVYQIGDNGGTEEELETYSPE